MHHVSKKKYSKICTILLKTKMIKYAQIKKTLFCNINKDLPFSTSLRCGSFSEKNIEKKHLRRHYKNYCYFSISNIPVLNLSVGSRNMIKVSNNKSL